jgi:cytochrome P450 / NADPH-cytochrome P450 reductase
MKDQARKLVAAWAALPADEPLDARAWMERYTLEVSGRGACAYDFGLLEGNGCPHPFAAAVPASTKDSILRVAEPRPDFTVLAGRARRARKKAYRQHNAELFRTADLAYDDLAAMNYTTQVIKEALRIYPPLPVTIRRSLKDGTLGRYRIRKGDIILVGSLAAQRDPRYWGPNPDQFDPGQFAMGKVVHRPRHAFIPFSIGKRQCMAQEVTFMMLRVVLFEIGRHYRLALAPGAAVTKNTVVSTKPVAVPVILLPRQPDAPRPAPPAARDQPAAPQPAAPGPASGRDWGQPTEIPESSAYRHLVTAYGSNFGTNEELAKRFAGRARFYGYTSEVITLDELAASPPRTQPWLLVVMTSTYTFNPPSNAAAFKAWLDRTEPGGQTWRNCRYLVWGLGNSQWNAFLAFPRYVHAKLAELGATPLTDLAYADVGTSAWQQGHADWNARVWPVLLELAGARPTQAAAARAAAEQAASGALTGTDSHTAMHMSLYGDDLAPREVSGPTSLTQSRVLLAPTILTNAVGIDTVEARAQVRRELQAAESPKRTRHLEVSLPPGLTYLPGDHLGVCPKNDEEQVERLARHLGAALAGLFISPKTVDVHAVPRGVVLQVRNVLTNLVDITGRPTLPLLDLLHEKATDPGERSWLAYIKDVLEAPDGPDSPLRAAMDVGGYDVVRLLDESPGHPPVTFLVPDPT